MKIREKCFSLYNCHESISVDEGMVPFKGRLKIKVRMPDKPVKYGIKLFTLCDSIVNSLMCMLAMMRGMLKTLERLAKLF